MVGRSPPQRVSTSSLKQQVKITVVFCPEGKGLPVNGGQRLACFNQPQMAGWQRGCALPWHEAQQGNPAVLAHWSQRLPQQVGVAVAAHMGADHAQKVQGACFRPDGSMAQKALGQRGNRLPHAPGIEHQQQGQPQQGGQMGCAASALVAAVKQAHGTFYNQNVWQNIWQNVWHNMGQNVGRGGCCAACQHRATRSRHAHKNAL